MLRDLGVRSQESMRFCTLYCIIHRHLQPVASQFFVLRDYPRFRLLSVFLSAALGLSGQQFSFGPYP